MSSSTDYSAENIEVLQGLDAVRRRPGMYVGGLDQSGLQVLVETLLQYPMEAFWDKQCSKLELRHNASNSVTVSYNKALPTRPSRHNDTLMFDDMFLQLFGGSMYARTMHAVDFPVVNALSIQTHVKIWVDGKQWERSYVCGYPVSKIQIKACENSEWEQGTSITFRPDNAIFLSARFCEEQMRERCQHVAALCPAMEVTFLRRQGEPEHFHSPAGLSSLLSSPENNSLVSIQAETSEFHLDLKLQAYDKPEHHILGFINSNVVEAGSHTRGLMHGLLQRIREDNPSAEMDQLYGIDATLHVYQKDGAMFFRRPGYEHEDMYKFVKEQVLQACQQPNAERLLSSIYIPIF